MSPQRLSLNFGTRVWIDLPDGFGRHGATLADAYRVQWAGPEELEMVLSVTYVPDSEAGELVELGSLEPHSILDIPGLGVLEIVRTEATLGWEAFYTVGDRPQGSERDHVIKLRLRRPPHSVSRPDASATTRLPQHEHHG